MHKIVPSFLSLAFTFSFVAPDAQAAPPPRVEPAIMECSVPKAIGKGNLNDWGHQIATFGGVSRIYFSRRNTVGFDSVELNPGADRIFGTRDDRERNLPGQIIIVSVYEDLAVVNVDSKEKVLRPGADNLLFTNDDIDLTPANASEIVKNGDLLAWLDTQTEEMKVCDLSISTGRGSCNDDLNHWVAPLCLPNTRECVAPFFDNGQMFYPSKQIINGQSVPMVLAMYDVPGLLPMPRVTMMSSGLNFPLPQLPLTPTTDNVLLRGDLLIISHAGAQDTPQMGVIDINFNSSAFMTRRDITNGAAYTGYGYLAVDTRTNNGAILPPHLISDDMHGMIYRDELRKINAKVVSAKGTSFTALQVQANLVLGLVIPQSGSFRTAVAVCP